MSTAVQVLAVFVGVMLVAVWVMEAFLYRHPRVHPMLLIEPRDFEAVKLWNVNVGFYNLTTAVAMFLGVVLVNTDHVAHGEALILFTAGQHVFLAAVLLVVKPKLWLNAILESAPNLVILVLAVA